MFTAYYTSDQTKMTCGVLLGSIVGPPLLNSYMLPQVPLWKKTNYSYADDTQVYITISTGDYSPIHALSKCIKQINNWMCQNFI